MIYYVVLDTNVIVSAFLKKKSIPNYVVELSLKGPIIPLINKEILTEYEDVLFRKKFNFPITLIKDFLEEFVKRAVFIDSTPSNEVFVDYDDKVFYEIVLTAKNFSNAYLVTGNKRHFPVKPFVVTPKEMLEIVLKK